MSSVGLLDEPATTMSPDQAVAEVINSLSALSCNKEARRTSVEDLLSNPRSTVAEKLVELAGKAGRMHATDYGLALDWTNALLSTLTCDDSDLVVDLVATQGEFLTKALVGVSELRHGGKAAMRMQKGLVYHASQAVCHLGHNLRSVLDVDQIMTSLLAKHTLPGLVAISLIVNAVHLTHVPSTFSADSVQPHEQAIAKAWCEVVLNAKPADFAATLAPVLDSRVLDLLWSVISSDTLIAVVAPQVNKALLRSPEGVIKHVLVSILRESKQPLDALTGSPSLVSNLTSSNQQLRQATAHTFGALLEKTQNPQLDGLLTQFKRVTNSDQRALFASVLAHVPLTSTRLSDVAAALSAQVAKEGTESTVTILADALVRLSPSVDEAVAAIKRGLGDARKPVKREWVLALASTEDSGAQELYKTELTKIWTEIVDNVNAAASAKLASAAFGLICLITPQDVPATLFAARVVDHVTGDRELIFLARACSYVLEAGCTTELAPVIAAFVHSASGPPATRLSNFALFKTAFNKASRPQLQELVRVLTMLVETREQNVAQFVGSVSTAEWVLDAFILAQQPLAAPRGGWIGLCLRSQVDPNALVRAHPDLFKRAVEAQSIDGIATLAFVAPEIVAAELDALFTAQLVGEPMSEYDALVLATPEGQLAKPGTTSSRKQPNKQNLSDEAWEEELRREIAAKHGQLTEKDKELLAQQSQRRAELQSESKRVEFCCALLVRLASDATNGAENGILTWLPNALSQCLAIVKRQVPGANAATECLSELSVCLSDRFKGPWKRRAAELVLKGRQVTPDAVSSLLYMLNPVSDKRLLDTLSLVYILPILQNVLAEYSGDTENEEADECVLLVTSLIANQAEVLAKIPRGELVAVLLDLLAKFAADRHVVKDCLRSLAQRVDFTATELHMLLDSSVAAAQDFVKSSALDIVDAEIDLSGFEFCPEVWISRFGQFGEVASQIWDESQMVCPANALDQLLPFFAPRYAGERAAIGRSWSAAARLTEPSDGNLAAADEGFTLLAQLYLDSKKPPKPEFNSFGLEIKKKWVDPVDQRISIVAALQELTPYFSREQVVACANLVVKEGVTESNPELATSALELGKTLIDCHGQQYVDDLLPIFDTNHIVLFGFAAQHLPSSDPRLTTTVKKLLAALPADDATSNIIISSLSPLAPRIDYQPVLGKTLDQTFEPTLSVEQRRGAAFGFAGLACGVGLSALGDLAIVNAVSGAVEDRKNSGRREGAQWLVHALAQAFGPLFEPYALELMPQVLAGLGDQDPSVRQAANESAKSIMAVTSAYGIKQQIPVAMEQLADSSWRAKKGAVELLGSMAFLSPRQLAASLATIVPAIARLLGDSHKEVRSSAKRAMKMFGQVISNPEIRKLVPTLLAAISDPTTKTEVALTDLLKTRFMHYIDSPSLALIIFVVQRGLRDRSASVKHKSCQIVGNMSILTAANDLVPYLPAILPELQVAMTDPVQQTSAVACKALGVLIEKLGEQRFPQVIPDLMDKLRTDDPKEYGNRWGSAQGLSEVLHGLGTSRLEEVLPEIIAGCVSKEDHIRQGFTPLLLLLPGSFGASLTPYLPELVPPLLRGLADHLEDVRDHSLKAGRRIVRGYAATAVDLLLPELESGLWNPSWRIRLASVELVGDLMLELLGKGSSSSVQDRMKALAGDDAHASDEQEEAEKEQEEQEPEADKALSSDAPYMESNLRQLEVLGAARRDRVIAAIFMCRADIVATVRQAAADTWSALIQNTPRTVKLILPTLIAMLVHRLGDADEELQTNAARALSDTVRRVSGALKLILPTFEEHLADRDARQGICLGLVELIPATQAAVLEEHERELMHLVRTCLQDSSTQVREAATRALDELHTALGDVAGDMLPEMVEQVVKGNGNDEAVGALAAIKEMLASTGASSVLAAALPPLLQAAPTQFHAAAVAELCLCASQNDVMPYITDVVDGLIRTNFLAELDSVLAHACPEAHMLSLVKNDEQLRARVFGRMASYYSSASRVDQLFASDWTVFALHGLEAADSAAEAEQLLKAITSTPALTKADLAHLVTPAYETLQQLSIPVPAFAESAKGPQFVLPFFLQGLTLGSNLEKEQSALALSEIIKRTQPATALKPVVTQITGPLIRIVGERTPADVKASIIYTLNELLVTIPAFLKPFLPQLQRTFAKNLSDTSSSAVRARSVLALGSLIKLQARIDPLAKEIIGGVRSAPDSDVRAAFLAALFEIVNHAGENLGAQLREQVVELVNDIDEILGDEANKDIKQMALFAKIGSCVVALPTAEASAATDQRKMAESLLHSQNLQSVLNANALLVHAVQQTQSLTSEITQLLVHAAAQQTPLFSENGVAGLGKLVLKDSKEDTLKPYEHEAVESLVEVTKAAVDQSHETRRLALVVLGALPAYRGTNVLAPFVNELAPALFTNARDRNIPIKLAGEHAFRALFDFEARKDAVLFEEWFASAKDGLDARMQRSLPEYVRRVALRAAARDDDDIEPVDELREVWMVGLE